MSQVKRRDDKKQPRSSGVGGIGGLIVLGGVVAGAALLGTLKRRTHKRITGRSSSGQRLPREDGKVVAQVGLLSAIGNPISDETQNGESKWNEDAFVQQEKGDDLGELLPDNEEIKDIELENLMESKDCHIQEDMLDYTRDSELLEQNGKVVKENDDLIMENLPIHCEEEEDQGKENVEEVDEKERKDENGIMRIVDVVDKCSFGITADFKKDECSNGQVSMTCPKGDELIPDMNSLALENHLSIQEKEKEVEGVDHEVEGDEFADEVVTNHSIELIVEKEEYVFSNHSIQNELHVHREEEEEEEEEEEGEHELSDKVESSTIGLIPEREEDEFSNEKDHFPTPVQDIEKSGGQEEPHYELEEVDKESSCKVECLSIKLIDEKEEDELSTQEHFSSKTLAAEDKQVHLPTEVNSLSDGSYEIENQEVNSDTNEDVIESSDRQQSPSINSKEGGGEQSLACSIDTKEPIRPFNLIQLNEFERSDNSPNEKTAHELMSEQEQEHNVRNEQQEVRNAHVMGDEKMNLKTEEVKVVYGVYGSKDRGLLELVMPINMSTTMLRYVLVGLLLVFVCHIFAKSSSFNHPF